MATPSFSLTVAKALCTAAEYRIVRATVSSRLSAPQIQAKMRLVRDLAEKWRVQSRKQTRDAQKRYGSRDVEASGRSRDKEILFAAVLGDLERRAAAAAKQGAATTSAGTAKAASSGSAAKPAKSTRKATSSASAKASKPSSAAPSPLAGRIGSALSQSSLGASDRGPASAMPITAPAHRAVKPSRNQQRAAAASATANRFRESGERRTMSHVKAAGKRAQARSDGT